MPLQVAMPRKWKQAAPKEKRKFYARRKRRKDVAALMQVDHRSRLYDAFVGYSKAIRSDLGNDPSTLESTLVDAAAALALSLNKTHAKVIAEAPVDVDEWATLVSSFVRVAGRLGLERRARDVLGLADYLKQQHKRDRGQTLDGEILEAAE